MRRTHHPDAILQGHLQRAAGLDPALVNIPWVTLNDTQRTKLVPPSGGGAVLVGTSYWRGPYLAFQKSIDYGRLRNASSALLLDQGGPIYDVTVARGYPAPGGGVIDSDADRIPTDPWGSPYIFINLSETGYGPRLLYSTGPDGLPGVGQPPISGASYHSKRTGGQLGQGDDLEYIF